MTGLGIVFSEKDEKEKNQIVNRKMIYMVWEILALGVQQDVQVQTSVKQVEINVWKVNP